MDTMTALAEIGVSGKSLSDRQRRQFDTDGFFIIEDALSGEECDRMAAEFDRLVAVEQRQSAVIIDPEPGVSQLSDLFNKSQVFDPCLEVPAALQASAELLGEIKIHGANIREPWQGKGLQPLHSDVTKLGPEDWQVTNILFLIDPLTEENGATRIVPGSHRWVHLNVPACNIFDDSPRTGVPGSNENIPSDPLASYPGEVRITSERGAAAVVNAHIWHGGTENTNGRRRRMLHLTYTRRDLPQQFEQRKYLTPGLYRRLSRSQRFLYDVEK
jgi:hypothetical protein